MAESNHERRAAELPLQNENGYYEIRIESIGGLGANLCGKLLGELGARYLGLNAAAFSSYGSEKRGSPVKSYVRFSLPHHKILHNSPVMCPHLLVLFHRALGRASRGADGVLAGVSTECTLVVNTPETPEHTREEFCLYAGTVCTIDALALALEYKCRLNMVMLGAVAKASGFIKLETVKQLVTDTLGKKYPSMLENNLLGTALGYQQLQSSSFAPDGRFAFQPYSEETGYWGYQNAPIGGINSYFGSTVTNDLSPSREGQIPLFLPEKCIHCALCDSTCPDMVFQFLPGEYRGRPAMLNKGLDYYHCKGCLRCVDICPTGALVCSKENEHPNPRYFVRNKDLVANKLDYEPAGADPSVTGEAYLDEKRVDGGLR